MESEKITKF